MKKSLPLALALVVSLLPALSFAAEPGKKAPVASTQAQDNLTPKDVVGMAGAVGFIGALTLDATVGEVFVRAYPSKKSRPRAGAISTAR